MEVTPGRASQGYLLPQGRQTTRGSGQTEVPNDRIQAELTSKLEGAVWLTRLVYCSFAPSNIILLICLLGNRGSQRTTVLGLIMLEAESDPKSLSHAFCTTHQVVP